MGNDYLTFYTDNTTAAGNAATITFNADFSPLVSTVIAEKIAAKKKTALDWLDERIAEVCVTL